MSNEAEAIKVLFQQEYAKMVAVISRLFGLANMEAAEDIVSETFIIALRRWEAAGIPPNPQAWLYTVAKRKTLQHLRRGKILKKKILPQLKLDENMNAVDEGPDFSPHNIRDSQLQMLFAVCNPAIAAEAQIGLALRVLCGFGIEEIADAFLTNKETINKRLFRAKEKLRAENIKMELPQPAEIETRLDSVLHVIYLLFNEGYYSRTQNQLLRKDLCLDAIRLGQLLTDYGRTNVPRTNALLALMCFHSSRFGARMDSNNSFILFEDQDPDRWNSELINEGFNYLNRSAQGNEVTSYHLEAKIAGLHCIKGDFPEKWKAILDAYDQLLLINYSPAVALNRIFALYKVRGRNAALEEANNLALENNHFYHILLGELYQTIDNKKAIASLERAYELAISPVEKQILQLKIYHLQ